MAARKNKAQALDNKVVKVILVPIQATSETEWDTLVLPTSKELFKLDCLAAVQQNSGWLATPDGFVNLNHYRAVEIIEDVQEIE